MNVRQVEKLVKQCNTKKEEPEAEPEDDNKIEVDYTAELERQLTLSLGRMVKINDNKGKKGKKANSITIEYEDNEDLDRLIEILTAKH